MKNKIIDLFCVKW